MSATLFTASKGTAMTDWRDFANCGDSDPDLFFPTAGENTPAGRAQYAEAHAICAVCPVWQDCLDYAIKAGLDSGMFGGVTPNERMDLIRKRRGLPVRASA
jgi:WhiB family redox-sensing transcriptional regulator